MQRTLTDLIKYPTETVRDADYADDLVLLTNTPAQVDSMLHSMEQTEGDVGLYLKENKTEFMF